LDGFERHEKQVKEQCVKVQGHETFHGNDGLFKLLTPVVLQFLTVSQVESLWN